VAKLFLDANVFLYAIGADSPHRAPCRDVLQVVGQGKLDGITSSEVLQEILHVRSRRVNVADAANASGPQLIWSARSFPSRPTTSSKPAVWSKRMLAWVLGTRCTPL